MSKTTESVPANVSLALKLVGVTAKVMFSGFLSAQGWSFAGALKVMVGPWSTNTLNGALVPVNGTLELSWAVHCRVTQPEGTSLRLKRAVTPVGSGVVLV